MLHCIRATYWHVFLNPLMVSDIFSNRFLSNASMPPSISRSSSSELSASRGDPDFAMTRNVSASKTTISTARQRLRRYVRCVVMRLMLGTRVCMTDDQACVWVSLGTAYVVGPALESPCRATRPILSFRILATAPFSPSLEKPSRPRPGSPPSSRQTSSSLDPPCLPDPSC